MVGYLPAESDTGMFGGNSNWRGPVWMPVNVLIGGLSLNMYAFYGDEFTVECPTGSGKLHDAVRRGQGTLLPAHRGVPARRRRPPGDLRRDDQVPGGSALRRDLILFHEYFHGDNGAGLGATHQTGWTGLVAPLLDFFGRIGPKDVLETERAPADAHRAGTGGGRTHRDEPVRTAGA